MLFSHRFVCTKCDKSVRQKPPQVLCDWNETSHVEATWSFAVPDTVVEPIDQLIQQLPSLKLYVKDAVGVLCHIFGDKA